jgi:RNA polymerase sigma factor (sigma-70 family)
MLVNNSEPERNERSTFVTTRWTQVLASQGNSEQARQALSNLCAAYYASVVAFLRSEGRNDESARDLAHEFFARVLERPSFAGADPARGRFRSYLLGALKHFLSNERARAAREKRGSQFVHEPLETDTTLSPVLADPASPPETVFDREWAMNVLDRAFAVLKEEAARNKTLPEFEALKPFLTGDNSAPSQAEVARELGMNDGALRVAIHRLRRRFREVVRAEIAPTVNDPRDVASEMQHLIAALS